MPVPYRVNRLIHRVLQIVLPLAAVVSSGCNDLMMTAGDLRLWAVPDTIAAERAAQPEGDNDIFEAASQRVRLTAAVNEGVSFQVLLRADAATARVIDAKLEDWVGAQMRLPATAGRIYRLGWVTASQYPTWYLRLTPHLRETRQIADVLIPIEAPSGGLPIDVAPQQVEALWVDLHVPTGTPEGEYRSRLSLQLANGQTQTLRLSVEVWPFALPQTRHLAMIAGVDSAALIQQHLEVGGKPYAPGRLTFEDPLYTKAATTLDETLKLLHDHRLSPMLTDVQPIRRATAGQDFELDWADYDRLVSGVLDGTAFEDRAAAVAWPLPVTVREPSVDALGGWMSDAYRAALISYLRQCVAHFDQRGWLGRHFLWLPVPGTTRAQRYADYEWLGKLAAEADPRINLVCDLTPEAMTSFGYLNDPYRDLRLWVGTWAPPAGLMDPASLARQRSANHRTWLLPDEPPYSGSLSAIAPPLHARSLAWEAFRYNLTGVLLPAINAPRSTAALAEPLAGAGADPLVWPGKPYGLSSPVASVRLKRLMRGAQDYEYLWLLGQNRRPGVAQIIAGDLFAYGGAACYGEHFLDGRGGGWVSDASAWSLARRLMAREIIAAVGSSPDATPTGAADGDAFEQQIEWGRLAQTVRRLRAQAEGVRLQIVDPGKDKLPLEVSATLSAFNATRRPFSGSAGLSSLPAGWQAGEDALPIRDLAPLREVRRVVRARAASIATNADGVFPMELRVGDEKVAARLCALSSRRLSRPLQIDGKLDDWPMGTNNVAADFLLVGAIDAPKLGRGTPDRPSLGTTVFVTHDSESLYIGFNCEDDLTTGRQPSRSNAVQYDGLWPAGEDVLEIVIDPTGRAVAPGDILHIVMKTNGVVIAERGAACLGAVAPVEGWPANVVAAVDDTPQPGRWTAEIRLPLASLGRLAPIWGINFARYHARTGEYASWSGAQRYLYSPLTLGNIWLSETTPAGNR